LELQQHVELALL
jgi:hypothetical protein